MPLSVINDVVPELAKNADHIWKAEFPSGGPLNLAGAEFSGRLFIGYTDALNGANLRGAKLDRSRWSSIHMKHADLSGADLRNAQCFTLCCEGSRFTDADLSGAYVDLVTGETPVDLSGANLSGATIVLGSYCNLNVTRANLARAKVGPTGRELSKAAIEQYKRARDQFLARISEDQRRQITIEEPPTPKGGCFVATAACGSPNAPEVEILRKFRDTALTNTWTGRCLMEGYVWISPPLARWIEQHPRVRLLVRTLLIVPLARCANVIVRSTLDKMN